ncbi:MAG: TfoX/Sxy family protein [bacterium]
MATSPATVTHMLDSLADLPGLRAARMFGEYGLYLDDKVVALICDDTLFAKATATAHKLIPDIELGPPYPGAKPHMILNDLLDDPELCIRVLQTVAADVPEPKPKKPKRPKT